MGKYDLDDYESEGWGLIVVTNRIANELAEANRLKRIELGQTLGHTELEDGIKVWHRDEELEDQA